MMNDGLTTPMSAVHFYWCLGVGNDVTQSAVQFIQCHLPCKLDNGYVKILPPNRIGLLLANQWTSRPTDCSRANIARKYSPQRQGKQNIPFASCRKSRWAEYGPSNAQQYVHDGQWPDWE
jgi:hypothetical protein